MGIAKKRATVTVDPMTSTVEIAGRCRRVSSSGASRCVGKLATYTVATRPNIAATCHENPQRAVAVVEPFSSWGACPCRCRCRVAMVGTMM